MEGSVILQNGAGWNLDITDLLCQITMVHCNRRRLYLLSCLFIALRIYYIFFCVLSLAREDHCAMFM